MNYKNLPGLEGKSNKSGMLQTLLIAPLSDFATIQAPANPAAEDGTAVTITGTHTFNTGKGFLKVYTTKDTLQILSELVGEPDGYNQNPRVEFFHPGNAAEVISFANRAPYDTFIILAKTLEGKYIQLGAADMGADVNQASYASGTLSSGRKGYSFAAQTYGTMYIYEGGITLKPEPAPTV